METSLAISVIDFWWIVFHELMWHLILESLLFFYSTLWIIWICKTIMVLDITVYIMPSDLWWKSISRIITSYKERFTAICFHSHSYEKCSLLMHNFQLQSKQCNATDARHPALISLKMFGFCFNCFREALLNCVVILETVVCSAVELYALYLMELQPIPKECISTRQVYLIN